MKFLDKEHPVGWCKKCGSPVNLLSISKDDTRDVYKCRGCEETFTRGLWSFKMNPSQGFLDWVYDKSEEVLEVFRETLE